MSGVTSSNPHNTSNSLDSVTNAAQGVTGGFTNGYPNQGSNASDVSSSPSVTAQTTISENLDSTRKGANPANKEDGDLPNQISDLIQNTLEKIKPTLKTIREHLDQADRDSQANQLDEDKVIYAVKPLIEQATNTLQECHGGIKGLDPQGMLQKHAQANVAKREASPEEYRLADLLKELTEDVAKTIEESKRRIQDMPKAKKDLSPLLELMGDPLFQIISSVGLLLNGVLGLLGNLLGGLGLGGIVKNVTSALGLDKIFGLKGGK